MRRQLDEMAALFQALGDETRLRIFGLLLAGEVCVCDIHESLKIPQSKASRHLAYLRKAGLVDTRRDGLWIHYRLANMSNPGLAAISDAVRQALVQDQMVLKDGQRLQSRTGCCLPTPEQLQNTTCCAPEAQALPVVRARARR